MLNSYQQAVVDALAQGQQVIEAAPGSGKTRTLEELVVALIRNGANPRRIGVFTFANKAAVEARRRIATQLFPDATDDDLSFFENPFSEEYRQDRAWVDLDARRAFLVDWVCTIHALSYRLLRAAGYDLKVLSGYQQREVDNIIKDGLAEMHWEEAPKAVKLWISKAILALVEPKDSKAWFVERLITLHGPVQHAGKLAELYKRYDGYCKRHNVVDFDQMVAKTIHLIRSNKQFKDNIADMFDYILCDEAQDTSPEQSEILWTLAEKNGNIVYIGDVDQCQPAGTLVTVANGTDHNQLAIEEIRPGMIVRSYDCNAGTFDNKRVLGVTSRLYTGPLYVIRSGQNTTRYTGNHRCVIKINNRVIIMDAQTLFRSQLYIEARIAIHRPYKGYDLSYNMWQKFDMDATWVQNTIVYSLEVEDLGTYVADGIVTHNSMYKFRGAEPQVLREQFSSRWPDMVRFNLPINYRSTQEIVNTATKLIRYNYIDPDDAVYLKPFAPRDDAPTGDAITYTHCYNFDDLCSEVITAVVQSGVPKNWYVLSRTRAECASIHMAFLRAGIPAVNRSGGLVLGTPHVRKVIAYAKLACNYYNARDDMEVLKEVANVASKYFKAPMTRRRHENGCTKRDWECSCPIVMQDGVDYSHARFYGEKSIEAARDWNGVIRQTFEKNKGGYPTMQSKGANDLVSFVERLEAYQYDAGKALRVIIDECVRPWLQAEEGLTDEDLAENGKSEDFDLLLNMVKEGMTLDKYLDEVEGLGASDKGITTDAVEIGTFHWSKGAQNKNVVVNVTRCPITPPTPREGQLPTGGGASIEEERRLVFVGVTRAQDYCMVVGSGEWNKKPVDVSEFVEEMELREVIKEVAYQ